MPLIHAVIEVDEIGLVLVDQFNIALIRVDQEALHGGIAAVGVIVEVCPFRVVEIRLLFLHFLG